MRLGSSAHGAQKTDGSGGGSGDGSRGMGQSANGGGLDGIPDPPKTFLELDKMTLKELRVLHDEKAKFEHFVSTLEHQAVVDEIVGRVRADVQAFERDYVAMAARMEEEVVDEGGVAALHVEIGQMETQVEQLSRRKEEWLETHSEERLMERLRMAVNDSEHNSEALEKGMLSNEMDFDEFLTKYVACRKLYHERCLKLEQLKSVAKKKSFGR